MPIDFEELKFREWGRLRGLTDPQICACGLGLTATCYVTKHKGTEEEVFVYHNVCCLARGLEDYFRNNGFETHWRCVNGIRNYPTHTTKEPYYIPKEYFEEQARKRNLK